MATPITFPTSSHPGEHPQETAGRLINAFHEPLGPGGPGDGVIHRAPGIAPFYTSAETGFRGITEMTGIVYAAFNGKLLKGTSAGGPLALVGTGSLAGTQPVYFARNNNVTPDQVLVSENGAFTFTPTTAPASYPDPDLPQPIDVTFGLGFFFYGIGSGRVYSSDLNSTAINPLNFITAESKPDALKRVVFYSDRLHVLSDGSIEIWGTPINPSGFPLTRSTVIPRGIAGSRCVTGFENGFDLGIYFIGNDNKVYYLNGYTPQVISYADIERDIEALADKSTIEMSCYTVAGHACIRIRCPQWTWVFDVGERKWHERKSYLRETSRSMATVFAFSKWLCGDTLSGNIGEITERVRTEFGQPLVWIVESLPSPSFPYPLTIRAARFKFTSGVGRAPGIDPIETDPTVQISWSDDGGLTWSNPVLRKLGRQGLMTDVIVNRTGMTGSHGRRWRLAVSDPVFLGLMVGDMDAQARAAVPRSAA